MQVEHWAWLLSFFPHTFIAPILRDLGTGPLQTRRQRRRRKLKSKALHSQVNEGDLRALTESSNLIEFYSFQVCTRHEILHFLTNANSDESPNFVVV